MPRFILRLSLLGAAAMTLATLQVSPVHAVDIKLPDPTICAAMYYVFAGPGHDDANYRAMQRYAMDHGGYWKDASAGVHLTPAEAVDQDRRVALIMRKDPAYYDEGTTELFGNELYACSVGYQIRPPAAAVSALWEEADFNQMWARDSAAHREKLAAEDARERANAQANASSAARNKAYGQANSALNSCMSMPSSVDMANPNYPRYTQMKWQCEDIRREAIRIAQASGDNATAMSYMNMRFPWQ